MLSIVIFSYLIDLILNFHLSNLCGNLICNIMKMDALGSVYIYMCDHCDSVIIYIYIADI